MALRDRVFRVVLEHPSAHEGWYTLAGRRRGPYRSPELLEADLLGQVRAWNTRAGELGGWVWRRTHLEVVVTLPEGVPVDGGEALTPWTGSG